MSEKWWLYLTLFMGVFMIIMNILAPYITSFLDAKTVPFEGEYAEKIKKVLSIKGIKPDNIRYAEKGEKDNRPNAYVAGTLGTLKIVLYDTLINLLTPNESLAVLGHELGHKEHKHNIISNIFGLIIMAGSFYIIGNLPKEWFSFFNIEKNSITTLYIGMTLIIPYNFIMSFLQNLLSRKNEYQADKYGANMTSKEDMKNALIKIYKKSNNFPFISKLYGLKELSHPTLLERLKNIDSI